MSEASGPVAAPAAPSHRPPGADDATGRAAARWVPSWELVTTKLLETRRRRGLMTAVLLLTLALPVLVLGLRLLFHAVDPTSYGPAGSPSVFVGLSSPMAEFGFMAAAALGATMGSTDLTEGMFRHLVVTGRSRVALYLARIPAGLAIVLPLIAAAFAALCLVTAFAGTPQPATVNQNGVNIPVHLDEAQLEAWLMDHLSDVQAATGSPSGPVEIGPGGQIKVTPAPLSTAALRHRIRRDLGTIYATYTTDETTGLNPPVHEMTEVGLWIELEVAIGFLVGLGFGSLTGQRTASTIVLIALEIIVTPILSNVVIPYFINGQRLLFGVAMQQLRPADLSGGVGHGRAILGARGLGIPPMPTWAMVAVIVGWIVVWSVVGAWRMATRDA